MIIGILKEKNYDGLFILKYNIFCALVFLCQYKSLYDLY